MYSEDLYYPIIDSISELLKVMIKILTDAVKSVRDSDKCKIQTNKTRNPFRIKNIFSSFFKHFFKFFFQQKSFVDLPNFWQLS